MHPPFDGIIEMLAVSMNLASTLVVMINLRKLQFYRFTLKHETMHLHHKLTKVHEDDIPWLYYFSAVRPKCNHVTSI